VAAAIIDQPGTNLNFLRFFELAIISNIISQARG
jgi:hypothetical protein